MRIDDLIPGPLAGVRDIDAFKKVYESIHQGAFDVVYHETPRWIRMMVLKELWSLGWNKYAFTQRTILNGVKDNEF